MAIYILSLLVIFEVFHRLCNVNDVSVTIYGGKIKNSRLQVCIAPVPSDIYFCVVHSHSNKVKELHDHGIFIWILTVVGKISMYLLFTLAMTSFHPKILQFLLLQKCSVNTWSSFLVGFCHLKRLLYYLS